MKLIAHWYNLRKRRCNLSSNQEQRIVEFYMNQARKKLKTDDTRNTLESVYRTIVQKPHVRRAADWNPKVSETVHFLYRCSGCDIVPLKLNHWIRCVKPGSVQADGQSSVQGCWRCGAMYENKGACLARWGSSCGSGCVLVINYDPEFEAGKKYDIFMIGEMSEKHSFILDLLRSAVLLESSSGKTTQSKLMSALERLNHECDEQLKHLVECRYIRSCTYETFKQRCTWEPYCEDPRLSLSFGNQMYKALYIGSDTPTMSVDARELLLECLCAHYDLEPLKPKSKGAKFRAWKWGMDVGREWRNRSSDEVHD